MFPNRFALVVFLRVVIISLTSLAFITLLTQWEKPATTLFLFLLLVYFTGSLIWYVNRTNRELATFLVSLMENETSVALSEEKLEKTFKGLSHAFKKVKTHFHKQKIENETTHQFLQAVVAHAGGGLICFDNKTGITKIFNRAAEELLGKSAISDLNKLNTIYPGTGDKLLTMNPGEELLIKVTGQSGDFQLSVKAAGVKLHDGLFTILSLQNIHEVLQDVEIESWRKLIRVFTHEIMNSITPIITLTSAIRKKFLQDEKSKASGELSVNDVDDIMECAEIIEERSHGLIDFIHRYKSISKLPELKIKAFSAFELIQKLKKLYCGRFENQSVAFRHTVNPENLKIFADQAMIEQVLINLLNNSLDALADTQEGKINLGIFKKESQIIIVVKDNGCGIPEEIRDNIFIPFFSGKEGGSGIGLSISRQIIRMHKGKIYFTVSPGEETVFTIELPAH